jgi:hypothetical protein
MTNAVYTAPGNKYILSNSKQIIYSHIRRRKKIRDNLGRFHPQTFRIFSRNLERQFL